jgi:hypothetical protein
MFTAGHLLISQWTPELVYVKLFSSILAVPVVSSISAATSILVLYRGLGNFRLGIDLSMPSLPHVNPKPMCLPGKPHEIELFSLAYARAGLLFQCRHMYTTMRKLHRGIAGKAPGKGMVHF